jgi:hypothetical protein
VERIPIDTDTYASVVKCFGLARFGGSSPNIPQRRAQIYRQVERILGFDVGLMGRSNLVRPRIYAPRDCASWKHLTNHSLPQTPFYGLNKLETQEITLHNHCYAGYLLWPEPEPHPSRILARLPPNSIFILPVLAILISSNVLKLPRDQNWDNNISILLIGHASRSPS